MVSICKKSSWALLGCLGMAGWTGIAQAAPVVITTTVNFSALDGGNRDTDGCVNGIFTADALTVRSVGAIILDTAEARFAIHGDVLIENSGAIRNHSIIPLDAGPALTISTFGNFTMKNDGLIRSHGRMRGGRIILMVLGNLELTQRAKIEAHNAALTVVGGSIEITTHGTIRLVNSTNRVTANGISGGLVTLCSGSPACPAIYLNSVVNAVGHKGMGGQVNIRAEDGGISVVGQIFRIAASGTEGNGTVTFFADTTVSPNPPMTNPPATVNTLGNPCP
ncbi:MAG: hypothetical protein AABZ47_14475 [Planctomycetota bacterium]